MTLKICHGLVGGSARQSHVAERGTSEPQQRPLTAAVSTEAVRTTFTASSRSAVSGDRLGSFTKAKDLAGSVAERLKQEEGDRAHGGLQDKRGVETARQLI